METNGQPGAVTYDRDGRVVNVFALDIADGVVQAIRCVVNPDKLRHLGPVPELARRPGARTGPPARCQNWPVGPRREPLGFHP